MKISAAILAFGVALPASADLGFAMSGGGGIGVGAMMGGGGFHGGGGGFGGGAMAGGGGFRGGGGAMAGGGGFHGGGAMMGGFRGAGMGGARFAGAPSGTWRGGAWNGSWHGGGWHGGNWHGHDHNSFGVVVGWPWYDPWPYYPYGWSGYYGPDYGYYAPYDYPPASTVHVYSGTPPEQTWYYCDNPVGYYPYIQSCSGTWQTIPVTPPHNAAALLPDASAPLPEVADAN